MTFFQISLEITELPKKWSKMGSIYDSLLTLIWFNYRIQEQWFQDFSNRLNLAQFFRRFQSLFALKMCFWSFRQTCSIDRWKWLPLMPILFSSPNKLRSSNPKVIDDLQIYEHNAIVCGIHNTHLITSWSYCCLFSLFSVSFVLDSTRLYSMPSQYQRNFFQEQFAYVHNKRIVSVCVRYNRNGPKKCCSICR